MKINPSNINVEQDVNAFFPMNSQVVSDVKFVTPKVNHYLELRDQPNQDVDIPAGLSKALSNRPCLMYISLIPARTQLSPFK